MILNCCERNCGRACPHPQRQYAGLLKRYKAAQTELREATKAMQAFVADYLIHHSCSGARELVDKVRDGLPICCGSGRFNLEVHLSDPVWIDFLNAWAYEHLSCGDIPESEAKENAEKLEKLFDSVAKGRVANIDRYIP